MPRKRHSNRKNTSSGSRAWTEADVKNILLNPVYAGVGPYPAIVEEQVFLAATARLIGEMGANNYVAQVRSILIEMGLSLPASLPTEGEPAKLAKLILDAVRHANPSTSTSSSRNEFRGRLEHSPIQDGTSKGQPYDLVYGSLYLDAGEGYELAVQQIKDTIIASGKKVENIMLGFDVVATPTQIQENIPQVLAQRLLNYIDQHYPTLKNRVIGITDNEDRRPIRDIILTGRLTVDALDNIHMWTVE